MSRATALPLALAGTLLFAATAWAAMAAYGSPALALMATAMRPCM